MLLGRRVEAAILDHANPRVLDGHVLAAAFEAPLDDADRATLGDEALERAAVLPELKRTPAGWVCGGRDYPAARSALRSAGAEAFTVVDATERRGARDRRARARLLDRPRGRGLPAPRRVVPRHRARPRRADARSSSRSAATGTRRRRGDHDRDRRAAARRAALRARALVRRVSVTEQVVAFQRKAISGGETLETVPLDLPADDVRDRGGLVPPRAASSSKG